VVGMLLGSVSQGVVDVTNCYAVPFEEDERDLKIWYLDHSFHEQMGAMYKKVNASEKLVGWYSTGPKIRPGDLQVDQLVRRYALNPVMVIIDVKPKALGIPTEAYLAVEDIREGQQQQCARATARARDTRPPTARRRERGSRGAAPAGAPRTPLAHPSPPCHLAPPSPPLPPSTRASPHPTPCRTSTPASLSASRPLFPSFLRFCRAGNFEHIASEIGASEPEEVGVEHLLRDVKDMTISTLSNRVTEKLGALKGLVARLSEVDGYLQNVLSGRLPVNHRIIYQLQDIFNLLPNLNVDELVKAFAVKTNDMQLAIYLASIIRAVVALHNLVDNRLLNKEKERKADESAKEPKKDEAKDGKEGDKENSKEEEGKTGTAGEKKKK
jgi:hypothetical protein